MAMEYIQMEELSTFSNQVCSVEQRKNDLSCQDRMKPVQDKSFKKSSRQPKYQYYTPLNVN